MKIRRILPALIAIGAIFTACRDNSAPQPVNALYRPLARASQMTDASLDSLIAADGPELSAMFGFLYGDTAPDAATLRTWSSGPAVAIFGPAVDSVYPDITPIEQQLGHILDKAADLQLALPQRRYAAVVWGNLKSMVITDSVMLIALNHYLGEDYEGYNNRLWPVYKRIEKTPARMPYDMAEVLVATQYPYDGGDNPTALSRMLYEGALAIARLRVVDGATPASALGYTDDQWRWFEENERMLWDAVVSRNLLYDTNPLTVSQLVDPAPATSVIEPYVPPRAGRYIGYRIMESYLKHNDTPLPELLSASVYNNSATLQMARYNP